MGSIGVIRSLGRAGYRVIAASSSEDALGLHSRYADLRMIYPSYEDDAGGFRDWLHSVRHREKLAAIVPSEGALLALRSEFACWSPLLPFSKQREIVYGGLSKFDLFRHFIRSRQLDHLPPFRVIDDSSAMPTIGEVESLGLPVFVKVDAAHAREFGGAQVVCCRSGEEVLKTAERLRENYHCILVQGFALGVGIGAFLLRWRGRVLAKFMHRRLHEVPHTGGASSYRRAWWDAAIFEDAVRRAESLDWEGVAMFEYRWDPVTRDFRLLELNGRFWGSIHLALYAGVDFPRLLLDAKFGREEWCENFDVNAHCRWTFPREVEYVWSVLKDKRVSFASRLYTIGEFGLLSIDPRVHSDLCFPGDRLLYLRAVEQSLRRWM